MDELLEQLRADAGFRSFLLDGQTILLEDYLRARPDRLDAVRAAVAGGRLQAGPWYVLADEQIPSGEALVRNLLLGTADAERLGHRLQALYSPDAFGHPAAWPALAREFGIPHGVIWRGVGAAARSAGDRFRWRAPDGRDVLVWLLPPPGYEIGAGLPAAGERLGEEWARVRSALAPAALGAHVPVFIGADHHFAPAGMSALRARLAALEPASEFRVSRLDEFLAAAAGERVPVPERAGELREGDGAVWALQGTHATRAPLKRRVSVLELWLERVAEPVVALARRAGGRDRRPQLEAAWRTLVSCQFHDTICGTVSDAVARAAAVRCEHVAALAGEVTRAGLFEIARHDPDAARDDPAPAAPALVLWNPAARSRGGVVLADVTRFRRDVPVGPPAGRRPRSGPGAPAFGLRGADGAVAIQVLDRRITLERLDATRHYPDLDEVDAVRIALLAPPVPGLGVAVLTPGRPHVAGPAEGARVVGRTLENRYVAVALEPTGAMSVLDRATRTRWSGLLAIESGSDAGDAYTPQHPARDRIARSAGPIRVRRVAAGPLVASLEARWRVRCGLAPAGSGRGRVDVRCVVMLHADSPVVRCVLHIDNQARAHRLRARLPLGLAGVPAVAGSAFTSVERPAAIARAAGGAEAPVTTAPAHRWVAVTPRRPDARGLAVLAPGFFEYEWTSAGDLLVTLVRAVGDLSRADLPARLGHAAWPVPIPDAQCLGADRVEIALVPVSAAAVARGDALPRFWEDAFLPPRAAWLRDAHGIAPADVGVALEGSGLVLSAVKPAHAGAGMVLRCYNATNRPAAGAWRFDSGVRAAYRVRADERESVPLVLEDRGRAVRFAAGPHEIVTIRVE